jgi:hypothetical protein
MKIHMFSLASLATALAVVGLIVVDSRAASLEFVGSDSDLLNQLAAASPPLVVVPWRSEIKAKLYDIDGNNVYGSAGYALFATEFKWPNPGSGGSSVPFASATYPNKIDLPSFVAGSQSLTTNKVGGWTYALIDDPELVNGYRDYNWGMTQDPPRPGPDQSPYLKQGILDGNDVFGNDPRSAATGAGRWAFTVGAGVPNRFRIGVMSDGLDANNWAATEVLLYQVTGGNTIVETTTTGSLVRNRFVDIHSFDIVGAQPGDTFAVFAKASSDGFGAISGVTFDVVPEPASASMMVCLLAACGGVVRLRRRN